MWHSQSMLRELIFTRAVTNMALVGPVGLYEGKQSRQTKQAHKHFFKWAKYHHFHKMSLKVELKYILCFVFVLCFLFQDVLGAIKYMKWRQMKTVLTLCPFLYKSWSLQVWVSSPVLLSFYVFENSVLGGDSALSSEYSFFSDSLCILTHFWDVCPQWRWLQ